MPAAPEPTAAGAARRLRWLGSLKETLPRLRRLEGSFEFGVGLCPAFDRKDQKKNIQT